MNKEKKVGVFLVVVGFFIIVLLKFVLSFFQSQSNQGAFAVTYLLSPIYLGFIVLGFIFLCQRGRMKRWLKCGIGGVYVGLGIEIILFIGFIVYASSKGIPIIGLLAVSFWIGGFIIVPLLVGFLIMGFFVGWFIAWITNKMNLERPN